MNRQHMLAVGLGCVLAGGAQAMDWHEQGRQVAEETAAGETHRWQRQWREQAREQQRLAREADEDRQAQLRHRYQERERVQSRQQGWSLSASNVGRSTMQHKGAR